MQAIENLRSLVRGERPVRAAEFAFTTSDQHAAGVRRSLELEDIEAMARSARQRGYAEGVEAADVRWKETVEASRRVTAEQAETTGVVAGLVAAMREVDDHWANVRVDDEDSRAVYRVGGPVERALDMVRDRISQMVDELREQGLHGERAPRSTGGFEAVMRTVVG
jgi:hypothetical protein